MHQELYGLNDVKKCMQKLLVLVCLFIFVVRFKFSMSFLMIRSEMDFQQQGRSPLLANGMNRCSVFILFRFLSRGKSPSTKVLVLSARFQWAVLLCA